MADKPPGDAKHPAVVNAVDPVVMLLDPFHLWRGLAAKVGDSANELADKAFTTEEAASLVNQAASASFAGKRMTKALMKRYFEALNLPTRADIQALDERLTAIEDRLIALALAVAVGGEVNGGAAGGAPRPARTKRPPPQTPAVVKSVPAQTPAAPARAARKRKAGGAKT